MLKAAEAATGAGAVARDIVEGNSIEPKPMEDAEDGIEIGNLEANHHVPNVDGMHLFLFWPRTCYKKI